MYHNYIIEQRTMELASYIAETECTVREAAKKFGISKSTVHKDIKDRLKKISPQLAKSVAIVMEKNKSERHIRGGLATRAKYKNKPVTHSHHS